MQYFTFDSFEKTGIVKHCFSTRKGGMSEGFFGSLNLGFKRGDSADSVTKNYMKLCDAVGFEIDNLVFSDQVHETEIRTVTKEDTGKGIFRDSDIKRVDGLVTNEPGVALTTFYADCVPLFFLDPVNKVIALSHAGWKGTLNCIGDLTVKKLVTEFNCMVDNILIGIGPSIGPCCFETDPPVANEFRLKLPFSDEFITETNGKFHIDLWGINHEILVRSGIPAKNIEVAGICTKCNGELFYSHRNMGNDRGSMAAIIEL